MVASFDDHARYGRIDLWRAQRQTPYPGVRYGKYGWPQAGRVFADTRVQGSSGHESGEDGKKEVGSGSWRKAVIEEDCRLQLRPANQKDGSDSKDKIFEGQSAKDAARDRYDPR